jgi:hypothetical protein
VVYGFGLALTGLVYACAIGLSAMALAGGGHGWTSAGLSLAGIVLIPAFGAALAMPRRARRSCLLLVASGMLLTDFFLVLASLGAEYHYLHKVWTAWPAGVTLWALLWCGWQFAVLAEIRSDFARAQHSKPSP